MSSSGLSIPSTRNALIVCALAALAAAAPAQSSTSTRIAKARAKVAAISGNKALLTAVTVPWQGDPTLAHEVYSGGSLLLHGVANVPTGCTLTAATWDPGDGSGPVAVPFTNPRALELAHTYNGVNGQPYIATLSVTDSCGTTSSDTFRVVVLTKTLDVEVNMAIDRGLWNLHKRQQLSTMSSIPVGYWTGQDRAAATASALQAIQVHGHRQIGDPNEDPYVEDVARGLAHLTTELRAADIVAQPDGDPDANGNGKGLEYAFGNFHVAYVGGQIIDALVASGTPNEVAVLGDATWVVGRSYAAIVQDILDQYAWGQADAGFYDGGWQYTWNGVSDNSAAQWMAIGAIAAERVFGSTVPQFVKTENLKWLANSQGASGVFGYTSTFPIDVAGMNTTPSGMIQLIMDGVLSDDPRFDLAESHMVSNWTQMTLSQPQRVYGMFATAKAMRLALPQPVVLLGGTLDWYGAEIAAGDPVDGLARRLVTTQQSDGSWDGYWVVDDLATAWSVIILSGTIIELGPIAVADAEPEQTAATLPVSFDGTQSYHLDSAHNVVKWEWDFDGDNVFDATGPVVVHSFATVGQYSVVLRVTDDSVPPLTSSTSVTVDITPPPFPPNSNPGGPYTFCQGQGATFTLDGSASADVDGSIVTFEWDFNPQPLDLSFNDATGPTADVTAFFNTLPGGTYDVGLRVTDDVGLVNTDFTKVNVVEPGGSGCGGGQNQPPDCSTATGVNVVLWPADQKFVKIDVAKEAGIVDPDGDPVTITVDDITQDEPRDAWGNHDGNTKPDGEGIGNAFAWIRAERSTKHDGRVYNIRFTATDPHGAFCQGVLVVSVPLIQGTPAVDSGQCCESTNQP